MTMLKKLLSLAALAMLIKLAMAANYTVGAPGGSWDQSTNLGSWASSQNFVVGDNLIFQYTLNHNVLEVSKADFDACRANNPIDSHSGGTTVVTLSSQGTRHFICGTAGHCGQGMKLEISTTASSAPPPATPLPPPPRASPSAPPPATPSPPPTKSPAPSPKNSRSPSPKGSPSPPPTGSPTSSPPSGISLPSVPPPSVLPTPAPSSATRVNTIAGASLGLGFYIVMMLIHF